MDSLSPNGVVFATALVGLFVAYQLVLARRREIHVPVVGHSGLFASYITALRWLRHAPALVTEGYAKHKGQVFKVAQLNRWLVMGSGPAFVEELRKAPHDEMSLGAALVEALAVDYTMGSIVHQNPYHIGVIKTQLGARNLSILFDDIEDEITQSFKEFVPLTEDWVGHRALETVMRVVCRTTNRVFVGHPLCRDPDYRDLNMEYTVEVVKASTFINLSPTFLRPLVGRLVSPAPKAIARAAKHLRPIIEERKRMLAQYGKAYPSKPNDMLMWLMEDPDCNETTPSALALRMLTINFAAIHTTSMTFTHALFHLASKTQYITPLREEAEVVVKQDGWSRAAISKMRKLDSFIKETLRVNGIAIASVSRKALRDFTFSDGTFIPAGTIVSVASGPTHMDEHTYKNATEFDGFRFANMRDEEGEGVKHQAVTTTPEYLPFGHGRLACPGRFFAVNELKVMLAHVVMTYDVKMQNEGIRPADVHFSVTVRPDAKAEVLFRKRRS